MRRRGDDVRGVRHRGTGDVDRRDPGRDAQVDARAAGRRGRIGALARRELRTVVETEPVPKALCGAQERAIGATFPVIVDLLRDEAGRNIADGRAVEVRYATVCARGLALSVACAWFAASLKN